MATTPQALQRGLLLHSPSSATQARMFSSAPSSPSPYTPPAPPRPSTIAQGTSAPPSSPISCFGPSIAAETFPSSSSAPPTPSHEASGMYGRFGHALDKMKRAERKKNPTRTDRRDFNPRPSSTYVPCVKEGYNAADYIRQRYPHLFPDEPKSFVFPSTTTAESSSAPAAAPQSDGPVMQEEQQPETPSASSSSSSSPSSSSPSADGHGQSVSLPAQIPPTLSTKRPQLTLDTSFIHTQPDHDTATHARALHTSGKSTDYPFMDPHFPDPFKHELQHSPSSSIEGSMNVGHIMSPVIRPSARSRSRSCDGKFPFSTTAQRLDKSPRPAPRTRDRSAFANRVQSYRINDEDLKDFMLAMGGMAFVGSYLSVKEKWPAGSPEPVRDAAVEPKPQQNNQPINMLGIIEQATEWWERDPQLRDLYILGLAMAWGVVSLGVAVFILA